MFFIAIHHVRHMSRIGLCTVITAVAVVSCRRSNSQRTEEVSAGDAATKSMAQIKFSTYFSEECKHVEEQSEYFSCNPPAKTWNDSIKCANLNNPHLVDSSWHVQQCDDFFVISVFHGSTEKYFYNKDRELIGCFRFSGQRCYIAQKVPQYLLTNCKQIPCKTALEP